MKGHYTPNMKWTNEIWGLDIFDDNDRYISCADDGTLRMWSAKQRKMLKWLALDTDATGKKYKKDKKKAKGDLQEKAKAISCGISPDQKWIVVGFKEGTVAVVSIEEWKITMILKKAKERIGEIKFSPDGKFVAIGSNDNAIYVHSWPSMKMPKKRKLNKHSSYITHFDWSQDSTSLHSTCGAYDFLFWDAVEGC